MKALKTIQTSGDNEYAFVTMKSGRNTHCASLDYFYFSIYLECILPDEIRYYV